MMTRPAVERLASTTGMPACTARLPASRKALTGTLVLVP
jgi:hypothetical protein